MFTKGLGIFILFQYTPFETELQCREFGCFWMPMWWNWQTRTTQNRVGASPCGFNSHHRHWDFQKTFISNRETPPLEALPVNLQKALEQARDTVCVPQHGSTCHAYGGMRCDPTCPAFAAGAERRRDAHRHYLERMIGERHIAGRGIVRISRSPSNKNVFILEVGEYVYDGQDTPVFTCFEKHLLPEDIVRAIVSLFP